MLQAPGFILDLLRLDTCVHICYKPLDSYGSFKIRHMCAHMLQAPEFILDILILDTYATNSRIHTGSFKIRHMCEHMLQAIGFILDLLRLDTCVNICYKP